tara:strand:- start:3017 stop:4165 length:1149 start_codon:yes stop_codon:yes gene_type:complete
MAVNKISGVLYSSVAKVSGKTTAQLSKMGGQTLSASAGGATTASRWVVVHDDRDISYIPNADAVAANDNWTTYDSFQGGSQPNPSAGVDHIHVAFGQDGSGGDLWVATHASDNPEISYHDDPTTGPWTGVNKDTSNVNLAGRRFAVQWGDGVWVATGKMNSKMLFRSTNGSDWTQISLASVSGITTEAVYTIASDGNGTWWFGQNNRVYQSTDGAQTWALVHTILDSSNNNPGKIRSMAFTNDTLIVGIQNTGEFFTAAVSDLTDWSSGTTLNSHAGVCFDQQTRIAAANGRVVVVGGQFKSTFDVNGKTVTMDENGVDFSGNNTSHGNLSSISTDGSTWLATCFSGDTFVSTDGGDTFTLIADNVGGLDILDSAPDVYLPL